MTNEELQQLVERISLTSFGRPFLHRALFNRRLRTTGGRYLLRTHNIEINEKYYEVHGMKELEGIIKHELCHYHLHLQGKGYQHRDKDFKELMAAVQAPRHCTPIISKKDKKVERQVIYRCKECHLVYRRKRKVDTFRYVCGKCKGRLEFVKVIKKDGHA